MIYAHTFTNENIKFNCEDLLHFFPVSLHNSKITILAFFELEKQVTKEILQELFINSIFINGIRRQNKEKIDFNSPNFDYLFEFVHNTKRNLPVSSYDLICNANEILKNNFLEINNFIQTLKKYRMYKKHGKNFNLEYPLLWNIFIKGVINDKNANYILENSKFISIPNIGTAGVGEFAINFIYKNEFCFLQELENLVVEKNSDLRIVSDINDIPSY